MAQPPLDPKVLKDLLDGKVTLTLEHYPSHPRPQAPRPANSSPKNDSGKKE